jgi:hypothetical protein
MSSPSRRSFLGAGAGVATGFAARPASAQVPLDRLRNAQRILLKGGIVLSLDSKVGDFEKADVLIEGQKIAAIVPNVSASSAVVVDASGMIVMPGFVDTHHHQYETLMRSILSDGNLGIYSALANERAVMGEKSIPRLLTCRDTIEARHRRRRQGGPLGP